MQRTLLVLSFVVVVGVLSGQHYVQIAVPSMDGGRLMMDVHHAILDHRAESPYRYRILSPLLVQALAGATTDNATLVVYYSLAHAISFPLMFLALYAWLRVYADAFFALFGVVITALYLPTMLMVWHISLYSAVELLLLCAALVVIAHAPRGWLPLLLLLTVIATLNRETALLIPLSFLALRWRSRALWRQTAMVFSAWGLTYAGLRLAFGVAPEFASIADVFQTNTTVPSFVGQAIGRNLMFAPFVALTFRGLRTASPTQRRLFFVGVFYLVLAGVFGYWNEVRLWLPVFALWLPALGNEVAQVALEVGAATAAKE